MKEYKQKYEVPQNKKLGLGSNNATKEWDEK